MTEREGVVLRSIDWCEMFRWLRIIKCFRLAIGPQALVFGGLAIALTLIGWRIGGVVSVGPAVVTVSDGELRVEHARVTRLSDVTDLVPSQPVIPRLNRWWLPDVHEASGGPLFGSWGILSAPVWEFFTAENLTTGRLLRFALTIVWTLAVWSFFGAAITRTAALQLTVGEKAGWGESLRWARAKWLAYFAAPLFPLFGVFFVVLAMALGGLFLLADWGVYLAGIAWFLFLIGGLVMTVLLVGLMFGWPLMWATISCEGKDSFDALSRTYAYVFQRPLRYLLYTLFAAVIGSLGWLLVANFTGAVIWLTEWAASWGCGYVRLHEAMRTGGGEIVHGWVLVAKLLALGFFFSYFWSASTAIYLLLRRDVDAMELDEVYLDADTSEAEFGVPTDPIEKPPVPPAQDPEAAAPSALSSSEAAVPLTDTPQSADGAPPASA